MERNARQQGAHRTPAADLCRRATPALCAHRRTRLIFLFPARMNLNEEFEKAVEDSRKLPARPDNETLLELYALFKQATEGDVSGERPGDRKSTRLNSSHVKTSY